MSRKCLCKVIIIITIGYSLLFMQGCQKQEEEGKAMQLTKEYAMNELGMEEAVFEGIDFETFVSYYNVTTETSKEMVEYYMYLYKKGTVYNYELLFENTKQVELTQERLEDMIIFVFIERRGEMSEGRVFDFILEKTIMTQGKLSTLHEEDVVGKADEKTKQSIITLLEKYDAYSWVQCENLYSDIPLQSGEEDGGSYWTLKIKFADGTVYILRGDSITDKSAPKDFDKFVDELKVLAPSQEVWW